MIKYGLLMRLFSCAIIPQNWKKCKTCYLKKSNETIITSSLASLLISGVSWRQFWTTFCSHLPLHTRAQLF